jgi:enoyl-[acyl-carrier protein] reductase II
MIRNNKFCDVFEIDYPIIQAGMVWCSGYKLALASANAGVLGVIGAGSMSQTILTEHIRKFKANSNKPFAVNVPLLYSGAASQLETIINEAVPIVITSAGNPNLYTKQIQEKGIKVMHVVSSEKFAIKAQDAGVDAIIVEGFEAGGHNGRDETTSLVLLQQLINKIHVPLIAAGGFATGVSLAAALVLGADAIQVGSRFAVAKESSAHVLFKKAVHEAKEGATRLTLKELAPVRLLKNKFYEDIQEAYVSQASVEELKNILGKGRSRRGIFEGDLIEGELEIGQIASILSSSETVKEIVADLINKCNEALNAACNKIVL